MWPLRHRGNPNRLENRVSTKEPEIYEVEVNGAYRALIAAQQRMEAGHG